MKYMFNALCDALFPLRCLGGCQRYDTWLCPECVAPAMQPHQNIDYIAPHIDLWHLALYQSSLIQRGIHELKYNGMGSIADRFGELLYEYLIAPFELAKRFDLAVPVPLHPRRLRERGFNQSELIAKAACAWPVRDVLYRAYYTPPQASLNREQRMINLQSMFACRPAAAKIIQGRRCVLIDDVCTTGTTLRMCAEQLWQAGAASVSALVIAQD